MRGNDFYAEGFLGSVFECIANIDALGGSSEDLQDALEEAIAMLNQDPLLGELASADGKSVHRLKVWGQLIGLHELVAFLDYVTIRGASGEDQPLLVALTLRKQ